jgi:uncharacterized protein (TIGR00661 family)
MKILYGIQGTGNGHLSRAVDVIPELKKHGDVDILVSGMATDLTLPYPVKFRLKGLSFFTGRHGGIDFVKSISKNSTKDIVHEISTLPVENYNLVVNDFEPISAWASKKRKVPCIGLGHQSAFLSKKTPRPKLRDPFGEWVLKSYAPVSEHIGFHFERYDKKIYTPVIRKAIREVKIKNERHYTVYLPAYDDKKLVKLLLNFPHTKWRIFSKYCKVAYHVGSISVFPVSGADFIESVVTGTGVICGAGFETPAEVLYLDKKLLVIPMKGQYEQKCNAAALKKMGVTVLKKLKRKSIPKIEKWMTQSNLLHISYPDVIEEAVNKVFEKYTSIR